MNCPLYSMDNPVPVQRPDQANCGLWYDKFCNTWADDFTKFIKKNDENGKEIGGKNIWIDSMTNAPVGNRSLLNEANSRRENMVKACSGRIISITTNSVFVSGLGRSHPVENGFTWHHTLGVPYLPGSSVKGVVRAWTVWKNDEKQEDVVRILGPRGNGPKQVGSVIFLDALPKSPMRLKTEIMTPHYGPWYQKPSENEAYKAPGDWHAPIPIPFLAVEAGQSFCFGIMPRDLADEKGKEDCAKVLVWLKEALEWLGAGAKTAIGMGRFEPPRESALSVTEEVWENVILVYDPGQRAVVANMADSRKATGINIATCPLIGDEVIAKIKKKTVKARVTVTPAGGTAYRLLKVEVI